MTPSQELASLRAKLAEAKKQIGKQCPGCAGAIIAANERTNKAEASLTEREAVIAGMTEALKQHECPGDGSTDQICYGRVLTGKKCTATEALSLAPDKARAILNVIEAAKAITPMTIQALPGTLAYAKLTRLKDALAALEGKP